MGYIDEQIDKLEYVIADGTDSAIEEAVKDCVSIWKEEIPTIKHGLDRYRARVSTIGYEPKIDNSGDARKLIGKLKLHKEKTEMTQDEFKTASHYFVVNNNQTNNADLSAEATTFTSTTLSATMSCLWSIPDTELTQLDKQDIANLLNELNIASNSKDVPKIQSLAKKVSNTILDKCIKYAPQLMSYVIQVIQNSLS